MPLGLGSMGLLELLFTYLTICLHNLSKKKGFVVFIYLFIYLFKVISTPNMGLKLRTEIKSHMLYQLSQPGALRKFCFVSFLVKNINQTQAPDFHEVPQLPSQGPSYGLPLSFSILVLFFFFFLTFIYLFLHRERAGEGQREKPKQALHCQHRARRGARTHKPWGHDLSQNPESGS